MVWGDRKSKRVNFQRGIDVAMIAMDGTWQRSCVLEDISDTGARLTVASSVEGLNLTEFFLLLSSIGLAFRRCALIRVNGNEIGVQFLAHKPEPKARAAGRTGRVSDIHAP
jgi:hypothetical protein